MSMNAVQGSLAQPKCVSGAPEPAAPPARGCASVNSPHRQRRNTSVPPRVTPSTLAETAGVVGKYGWLAEKSFAEMHFPLARACRACILQKVDLLGLI